MGKMNKFYEENCLMQMEFVRSDIFQGSVEKYVADAAKKLGGSVKFVDAVRLLAHAHLSGDLSGEILLLLLAALAGLEAHRCV